jgi:hypothetical protein
MAMKFFLHVRISCKSLKLMVLFKFQEALMCKKLFIHNFKLIGQFCYKNDVFELFQSFLELGIRVILETYTWKFPGISYISDLRQTRQKDSKTSFGNYTYCQINHVYFGFQELFCSIFLESLN